MTGGVYEGPLAIGIMYVQGGLTGLIGLADVNGFRVGKWPRGR